MPKLTQLRAIRERKALTQQELADKAGLSRVAVVRVEAGASEPYPSTIRKLAAALEVEPSDLMGADER
jgi:transcriptional regulator with XRE-family HTH domain